MSLYLAERPAESCTHAMRRRLMRVDVVKDRRCNPGDLVEAVLTTDTPLGPRCAC